VQNRSIFENLDDVNTLNISDAIKRQHLDRLFSIASIFDSVFVSLKS
jgi:hypothetical protein